MERSPALPGLALAAAYDADDADHAPPGGGGAAVASPFAEPTQEGELDDLLGLALEDEPLPRTPTGSGT